MGSFEGKDDELKHREDDNLGVDITGAQPQIFIRRLSSPSFSGQSGRGWNDNELQLIQDTMPFCETVPTEECTFETQLADLVGETQVMDDSVCVKDMDSHSLCTQLVDEFDEETMVAYDSEKSDQTEVMDYTELLSDDNSDGRLGGCPMGGENTHSSPYCEDSEKRIVDYAEVLSTGKHNTRYMQKGFNSECVASLRASSLGAQSTALKKANIKQLGQPVGENDRALILRGPHKAGDKVEKIHDMEKYNEHLIGLNEGKCRVGNSAVRKLFSEAMHVDAKGYNDNLDDPHGEDLTHLPHENSLAGLSYVNSQEPGELSQANALDFVDKFVKVNCLDLDQEVRHGKNKGEISNIIPSAKGSQGLAKRVNPASTTVEAGTFDWDDTREDEGGGAFFSRRKEELFNFDGRKRRSYTQPRKAKGSKISELNVKAERSNTRSKIKRFAYSDSKLVARNSFHNAKTAQTDEMKIQRNLMGSLDEHSNVNSSRASKDAIDNTVSLEVLDVGFDTQLAAEAMEALHCGEPISNHDKMGDGCSFKSSGKETNSRVSSKRRSTEKVQNLDCGTVTRKSLRRKRTLSEAKKSSASLLEQPKKHVMHFDEGPRKTKQKWDKSNAKEQFVSNERENLSEMPSCGNNQCLQKEFGSSTPVAQRTRQRTATTLHKGSDKASNYANKKLNNSVKIGASRNKRKRRPIDADTSEMWDVKSKFSNIGSSPSENVEIDRKNGDEPIVAGIDVPSHPKRSRTKRPKSSDGSFSVNLDHKRVTRSSAYACKTLPVLARCPESGFPVETFSEICSKTVCSSTNVADAKRKDLIKVGASKHSDGISDSNANVGMDLTPTERLKPSNPACTPPVNCSTPVSEASPICMGNEYFKKSCKKKLSRSCLMKEINGLVSIHPELASPTKDSRRRRDMANVRVLFSHHLDEDIIKQQKKIIARLGASVASSISDATHFVTDSFVRTRNMLEAIASGKPVVTHLWLESCNQTSCVIDERNHILRDYKKEKESGFDMPLSLARASQHPLLEGRRVLVTKSTKPGKDVIASLVRAVHGQAVERIGRTGLKNDKVPEDLIILSCEEDYAICVPFLEKGAAVYSSELLLNGIVTQKLEYERFRLFDDSVKRTRSTIWVRKDGNQFLPVAKSKK